MRHHRRYYWPGVWTRWKVGKRPPCVWTYIGQVEVDGKGWRHRYECQGCGRKSTVIEPIDGRPFGYLCKLPSWWMFRARPHPHTETGETDG